MNTSEKFKCGHVALLGRPNVGKSSLVNAMIKEKVAAVSPVAQTTRNAVRCILTGNDRQIVFVDTPGVHKPEHALGAFMEREAEDSLGQVDAICFVVEASSRSIGAKERAITEMLKAVKVPVILVINKIDTLRDVEMCRQTAEIYKKTMKIDAVVPVSALRGTNLSMLSDVITGFLPYNPPEYPEDMIMDSTERFLAAEVIREKIFRSTREEVPHGTAVLVEEYRTPDEFPELKTCRIRATIIVDRQGQKGIIIGKGGSMLKTIGAEAREELEKRTGYPVFLQLWVKVKPGWRKNPDELRRLGYSF